MRYLPQTKASRAAMLDAVGVDTVDALFRDVPSQAFIPGLADLPMHRGELEVERDLSALAKHDHAAPDGPFFLGAGTYWHHIPAAVDTIIQRSEFLTAYTPYQPEIAQGTLTAMFEFQTFIAQLTGQDIANASLYDGATATAEAALMAIRLTKRTKVNVVTALHPHYMGVLKAYLGNLETAKLTTLAYPVAVAEEDMPGTLRALEASTMDAIDEETACVIVQSPDFFGTPHAYEKWREKCDAVGAMLVVVVTEILSLGLLPAPECADIVCGEAQSIGLPMSFGGPHLGFFATREKFVRQMPGRLCGMTKDAEGRRGFVLTLNTREQHIRREKATSNICTNQGLCALAFTVHMGLLGEQGFRDLARLNHEAACRLADRLGKVPGARVVNDTFFNEFTVELPGDAEATVARLAAEGIIAGLALDDNQLLVAATEMTTEADMDALCAAISGQ